MNTGLDAKDEWLNRPSKRLEIYPLESATSFASRLARLKGAPSLTNWCADVGIGRSDLMAGRSSALARLAHLGNIDLDLLTHHAVMDKGRHGARLLGQDMRAGALSWGQVRACPACLRDDLGANPQRPLQMFGRAPWQMTAYRICPTHRLRLVTLDKPALPDHHASFRGALKQILSGALDAPSPHEPVFESHLLASLQGEVSDAWLGLFRLDAIARISEVLGTALLRGRAAKLLAMTDESYSAVVPTGFKALAGGPEALEAAFNALRAIPGKPQDRPQARYGVLYRWLSGPQGKRPEMEAFRTLFRGHILANWSFDDGTELLGQPIIGTRVHTVATAARAWNIPARMLRKALVDRGLVSAAGTDSLDLVETFRPEDARDILEGLSQSIPRKEAMQRLGVSRPQLDLIEESGLLPLLRHGDRVRPVQSSAAVDTLLERVATQVTGTVENGQAGWLSLAEIRRRMLLDFMTLLHLLLDGKIADVRKAPSGQGLDAIRLQTDDVARALGAPILSEMMNRAEVAKRLRTSREGLHAIETAGC